MILGLDPATAILCVLLRNPQAAFTLQHFHKKLCESSCAVNPLNINICKTLVITAKVVWGKPKEQMFFKNCMSSIRILAGTLED